MVTLRTWARSLLLRSARSRAKGRRERRRAQVLGTPEIDKRPGPEGPRVRITAAEIEARRSLSSSSSSSDEERTRRSEKESSKRSRISASSAASISFLRGAKEGRGRIVV